MEEEAKTKWCPFVRFHVEGKAPSFTVAPNREQRGTRCIGSACMAWRETGEWRVRSDSPWRPGKPSGDHVGPNNETRSAGFCGLAGPVQ